MGLNTCREQWKEQRKQNKIDNLKIHSTSLAMMFSPSKCKWLRQINQDGHRATVRQSTEWRGNNLSYKAQGILQCITFLGKPLPVAPHCQSETLFWSEVSWTHLKSSFFFFPKPLLNWLLGFQIILVLFENIQSGCNSNLVFRHIKPQDNLKEPSSLYGLEMLFTQHCFTLSERLRRSQLEVLCTWLL